MRAATARRMAKNTRKSVVDSRVSARKFELDNVLHSIAYSASTGSMFTWIDVDLLLDEENVLALEKLGYTVEYVQSRPTARPKWRVSWEAKAA